MRFTYSIGMPDPGFYLPLARAAEEAGWDTISVPDSICYPRESSSKYPYTDTGGREFLENKPFIEPFSLVPTMAAVTQRIEFLVAVLKLPVRQPVMVAKQATSVAVLSGNRFKLGVGSSPWPDDYEVCGVPWERRGARTDECIAIVRGLAAGGWFEFHGELYDVPAVKLNPVPSKPLPILVGGHADRALRRAALSDGWVSASSDEALLTTTIATLHRYRAEVGRDSEPFEIHVRSPHAATIEGVLRLAELGVTDVGMRFQDTYSLAPDDQPLDERLDALRRYADTVIAPVRERHPQEIR
ncbi:MAG: TIGR03619 family F420-dependent LLM class oxidoreductase [Actinobacteria bacterium]|nr:TIGR03619 family F420-dependent LLM class oxidoreductase [Actinomycetota bacterium]